MEVVSGSRTGGASRIGGWAVRAVRLDSEQSAARARPISGAGLAAAAFKTLRVLALVGFALATGVALPLSVLLPVAIVSGSATLLFARRYRGAIYLTWVFYLVGFGLFNRLRLMMHVVPVPTRYEYVIDADRALFQGVVPTVWLQQHWYVPGQADALVLGTIAIHLSYFFVVHLVAVVIWRLRPEWLLRYALAVLATLYLGLGGYALLPTAPPWLAAYFGHLPDVTRILATVMTSLDTRVYETGHMIVGRHEVGAMPSLHLATTCIVAFGLRCLNRWLGLVGVLYVLAMGFSLVYLGEHYVTDLLVGAAVAGVAWYLTGRILARRSAERAQPLLRDRLGGH